MRIIGLLFVTILLLAVPATVQAQSVPWPSISPSYRCQDDLAVFVLTNVGADMPVGAPYTVSTPHRVVEQGVFLLVSGGYAEWWFDAPGIPLTFAYARPDSGATVSMTQRCGIVATGEASIGEPPPVAMVQKRYLPYVAHYAELRPCTRCYGDGCNGVHLVFAPLMVTP